MRGRFGTMTNRREPQSATMLLESCFLLLPTPLPQAPLRVTEGWTVSRLSLSLVHAAVLPRSFKASILSLMASSCLACISW